MSVRVMSMVFEAELQPPKKLVLLALADHANDDGGRVFPSMARVALKVCMAKRPVQRSVGDLRRSGVLEETHKAGARRPTEYRIILEELVAIRGDILTPIPEMRGDIAVSPESSVNVNSVNSLVNSKTVNLGRAKAREPKAPPHIAITTFRTVTHRYPLKKLYDTVISAVGDKTADELTPYFQEWIERGYNRQSIKWLTEWATSGHIPRSGNGKKTSIDTFKEAFGE